MLLAAIALTAAVSSLLWLVYFHLAVREIRDDMMYLNYSVNLAFYNDMVAHINGKPDVTPEEELNLVMMQENLTRQAEAIGLEFSPFQRPKSLSDPD